MYGVWNGVERRFVFGIKEDTKKAAWRQFIRAVGKTGYKWRFEVRPIPPGFKNPKNPNYEKRRKK
jgi:hypothetical protein